MTPTRDAKYDVELTPVGSDTLRVMGYSGTKWLSETMTWKRAPADLQKCTKSAAAAAPAAKTDATAAATKPAAEPKADVKAEAKTETKSDAKAAEAEPNKDAAAPATDEPRAKTAKKSGKGEAAAKIAEALNLRKTDGGRTCKIDVPFLDATVAFPCEN